MSAPDSMRLALLVRQRPHRRRETRAEPDLGLAAAAVDCAVEIYFMGDSILQLAQGKHAQAALLPPGYGAWTAVTELSEAVFFAAAEWLDHCRELGIELAVPVKGLDAMQMKRQWRRCDRVLVV